MNFRENQREQTREGDQAHGNGHADRLEKTPSSPSADLSPTDPTLALRGTYQRRHERGLYAYHRGDYTLALIEFERACESATQLDDYTRYVDSCTYYLRILAEREEFSKIAQTEERIISILNSPAAGTLAPNLKSRALYVLGICACWFSPTPAETTSRQELAMRRFHEAIDFAMLAGTKEALAAPLYGAATVHYACGRYEEALRELERLGVLLSCLHLPDLVSASHLLRSLVLRNQGNLDKALTSAWAAFDTLKHHPHLVLYLHTLCVLGTVYSALGDETSARIYLDLADRSLKRDEFPRIARLVDEATASLGHLPHGAADLVYDTRTGVLIEKSKGEIRFDGQFILRDLLLSFLQNPGKIFTKEALVRTVWHEDYDPKIHDNKIYVTIKRLRALLESPSSQTEYILRAKEGYFLNPKARVLINDQPSYPETQTEIGSTEKTK